MAHKPFVTEKSPGHRPARMAHRIKEELSMLISEVRDKRLENTAMLTITEVQLSPDYKNATVLFSIMGEEKRTKAIEAGLNAAAGFLRNELRSRLQTKITPQLAFKFDKGLTHTTKMAELFKQLEAERAARPETTGSKEEE